MTNVEPYYYVIRTKATFIHTTEFLHTNKWNEFAFLKGIFNKSGYRVLEYRHEGVAQHIARRFNGTILTSHRKLP